MAKNTVDLKFDADAKPALRDMGRMIKKQQELITQLKHTGRESKRTATAAEGIAKGFKTVATAFVGTMGINAAIQGAINLTQRWEEHVGRVGEKTQSAAKAMTTFALLQPSDKVQERTRQVAQMGARYGIPATSPEAFDAVQAMQSLRGATYESGLKAGEAILQGKRAGINPEDAKTLAAQMFTKGMRPEMGNAYAYVTGTISSQTPDVMARIGRALPTWSDPTLAFAAGVPVLAANTAETYSTYLRAAGRVLGSEQGPEGKLWKKLGVTGKSEREKLAALYKRGITTTQKLGAEGIEMQEAVMGLAPAAAQYPYIEEVYKQLQNVNPNITQTEIERIRGVSPNIRTSQDLERDKAVYETTQALSKTGVRGTILESEGLALKMKAEKYGLDWLMGGEVGQVDRFIGRRMFPDIADEYNIERAKAGVSTRVENIRAAGYLRHQYRQATGQNVPGASESLGSTGEVMRLVAAMEGLRSDLKAAAVTGIGTD